MTAQEDMTNVVGEMTKQQGNDFSKIQDRFKNRLKLTSQDVAEVIQRRLLTKNDVGIEQLTTIYHAQSNNFKTLFDFGDGSQTYKNFRDRDHFIHSYPFKLHRRFLLLDEPDCWLRPDLVPLLVKIVHDAGRALGFQVLLISHHDIATVRKYADRIYVFRPEGASGVQVIREEAGTDFEKAANPAS